MASWRDSLRRVVLPDGRRLIGASFRGVAFFVDANERTGGRRIVSHELPFRDDNYVDDLGRKGRMFPVEGYVVGADYATQRDALISALEDKAGPGQLVHPSYGLRRVICSGLNVRENFSTDGGMARFAIEFTEAPAQVIEPDVAEDLTDATSTGANATHTAIASDLTASYSAAGLPSWALASAQTAITNAAKAVNQKLRPILTSAADAASLAQKVTVITAQASSLVRDPGKTMAAFLDAFGTLAHATAAAPQSVVDALISAYDFDVGPDAATTTATRAKERANQLALANALRLAIVVEAARAAVTVDFATVDDAEATRAEITSRLDDQALAAGDDTYATVVALRTLVLRAIPGAKTLASLITVSRPVPVPSLALAYRLYGSVDQEADIIARNRVRHPGFVAGDLRVLSNV